MPDRTARVLAALVTALLVVPLAPVAGGDAVVPRSWAELWPGGDPPIVAVAVSPDWPSDGTILAFRSSATASAVSRSTDRGASWETFSVTAPPAGALGTGIAYFDLLPSDGPRPLAFLLLRADAAASSWLLLRSADVGQTWETALEAEGGRAAMLAFSPAFAAEGLALLVAGGQLYRSTDFGTQWDPIALAEGYEVRQAAFSLAFSQDQTIFLAAVYGDPQAPDQGPGVLVSHDSGDSWASSYEGLDVEGRPYWGVHSLAVSPDYTSDGTLFAFATEPGDASFCLNRQQDPWAGRVGAVFRSPDRGGSWEPVFSVGNACTHTVQFALSPRFDADGIGFVSLARSGSSPASANCRVMRTASWGDGWERALDSGSYGGCFGLRVIGSTDHWAAVVALSGTAPIWRISTEGSTEWAALNSPAGGPSGPRGLIESPAYAFDRTLFLASGGAVWRYGPVQRSDGSLGCPFDVVLGFGRVWEEHPDLRQHLDCPREPERAVALRLVRLEEERLGASTAYWPEEGSHWFRIWDDGTFSRREKSAQPSIDLSGSQLLDGRIQTFERGWMLWVQRLDGSRDILAMVGSSTGRWQRFPD